MSRDVVAEFEACLVGRHVLVRREHGGYWSFNCDRSAFLMVPVPWRIVYEGRLVLARDDDGQLFGNSEPVDAEIEANRLLAGARIRLLNVNRETGDLSITFDSGARTDIFNNSVACEGWAARFGPAGEERVVGVVAMGRGEVSFWDEGDSAGRWSPA